MLLACRTGTKAAADLLPGFGDDFVDGSLRGLWLAICSFGQDGFKLADEIGGADNFFAEAAQELDGSGIDHRDVHDVVIGRVLHGDLFLVLEEILQARVQFLPTGILGFGAGQRVEATLLDAVHELTRLAVAGMK